MAEKRVSVRLVAEGGKQVKAELEGIGRAGSQGMKEIVRATDEANKRLGAMGGAMGSVLASVKRYAIGFASAFSIRELARMSADYTTMTNSLRVLGVEQDQIAGKLGAIADIAARTRSPLQGMVELYQKISIASRDLGASDADVLRFTETVGLALGQQGGAASEAAGALMQLSQAIAGGTVRAEEFNSILEGAYPIALAAAKGIDAAGGSVAKLRKLVIDGKVSSAEFFAAILSQTEALQAAFAKTDPTIGSALQKLRDSLMMSVGSFDQLLGVSSTVARAIEFVADHMDTLRGLTLAAAAALTIYYLPAMATATAGTLAWIVSLITLRGALLATGIGALVVGAGLLIEAFLKLIEGAGSFGQAMALLQALALEVWDRIKRGAYLLGESIDGIALGIKAAFASAFASVLEAFAALTNGVASGWNALMGSMGLEGKATGLGAETAAAMRAEADLLAGYADAFGDSLATSWADLAAPLESWEALRAAAAGDTKEMTDDVTSGFNAAGDAAEGAGKKAKKAAKETLDGWAAVQDALARYAKDALNTGQQIGDALVSAFKGAEDAFVNFVTSGKFDFKALADGILADITRIALRSAVLGPIATWLGGMLPGVGAIGASIFHAGGMVGAPVQTRAVPASAFLGAGRYHAGGFPSLRHDEVPAILQRGERVQSRREVAGLERAAMTPRPLQVVMNISTPDVNSFRQAQGQVAADARRALERARRNL